MSGEQIIEANEERIADMSDGNPGAINVMCALCIEHPEVAETVLDAFAASGLRGGHIWREFKDGSGADISELCHRALSRALTEAQ